MQYLKELEAIYRVRLDLVGHAVLDRGYLLIVLGMHHDDPPTDNPAPEETSLDGLHL